MFSASESEENRCTSQCACQQWRNYASHRLSRPLLLNPTLLCAANICLRRQGALVPGRFKCFSHTLISFTGQAMRGRSWRNPQRVPANDVKTLMFPWTHYVWHLRSVASFEVRAAVSQVRRGYFKQGAYLESVSQPHTSVPHTVAPLHRSPVDSCSGRTCGCVH